MTDVFNTTTTLNAAWQSGDWRDEYAKTMSWRTEALPALLEVVSDFREGRTGLTEFHSQLTAFAFEYRLWGFSGFGLMFLNQVVNLSALAGRTVNVEQALRAAIASPSNEDDCRETMTAFLATVEDLRVVAEENRKAKPARGHVPYVLSFFWEAQDQEGWPVYYPASRKTLQQFGRFSPTEDDLAQSYVDFRRALTAVGKELGADTWQIEVLLWVMAQPEPPPPQPPPLPPGGNTRRPTGDIYATYAARNLVFNDELVTSLVLSLRTKRFVILSGISGTGKTQLALGLAQYFDAAPDRSANQLERTTSDERNIRIRMSEANIRMGRSRLRVDQQDAFEMPDRGASVKFPVSLPDGSQTEIRINNIGFTSGTRESVLLFFTKAGRDWLGREAMPGDVLHLEFAGKRVRAAIVKSTGSGTLPGGSRHELIPVKADWTDPSGLIGFFNPITREYEHTPLIDLMLAAAADPLNPYFAILDEMNLARVEYYFSDFLSAMESGGGIWLAPASEDDESDVPSSLKVPPNLFFIGTVNIDETTHAFSPKVLDRANVIEFNEVDVDALVSETQTTGTGSSFRLSQSKLAPEEFARETSDAERELLKELAREEPAAFTGPLKEIHATLERYHLHFGYRVINEVMLFVGRAIQSVDLPSDTVAATAFDLAMLQKILPKLGGGRELEEPLARLLDYCLTGESTKDAPTADDVLRRFDEFDERRRRGDDVSEVPLPRSAAKLSRMLRRLRNTGFTSYLE